MKISGIILIIISVMAFMGWMITYAKGKSDLESPIFFLFLFLLFGLGLWFVNKKESN